MEMGFISRKEVMCLIETDRDGPYLGPVNGDGFETLGNGLHLKRKGGLLSAGLILGTNSILKNITLLGMIL